MIDLVKLSFKNLKTRRRRTLLTMLGIFIGIAAVVALVSLGQGLQKTINDQFEKVGADKIFVQAKEAFGGFTGENAPGKLTDYEIDLVGKVRNVDLVSGQLLRTVNVRYDDVQRTLFVMSLPDGTEEFDLVVETNTLEIDKGRMLTHRDKNKVMVGYNLANKKSFGKNIKPGDKILVQNQTFEVVGSAARTGDPGMDISIIMPEDNVRSLLGIEDEYSFIIVKAFGDPDTVASNIERELRNDRDLEEGREDFTVQTATELIESFNVILNVVQVVFGGIAAISLFVGGIGIMNTMYTAVLERTREIGVMKAIGARNKTILTVYVFESGFLGTAGGVIGIILGMGISKAVEYAANSYFGAGTIVSHFPWYLILGTLLFAFGVGTISGFLPAYRASRLKPVDALRYE